MIAPTRIYYHFPALSEEQAVDWLCDAIVRRPKRIVPPSGLVAVSLGYMLPRTTEFLVNLGYQLVPESIARVANLDEERRARQRAATPLRGR